MNAEEPAPRPVAPRATYRLQFFAGFRFADAGRIAPYLASLGISHVYASPIFEARPGSTHGYDIVDHNRLNPELGTEAEFRAMAAAFRAEGLGLILDFVPNHMGIGGASNRAWLDVLEWGEASSHAGWFDINWNSDYPGVGGRLLVPFLGGQYGEVLAAGEFALCFDPAEGSFAVWAHDTHKLPVCPRDYAPILEAAGLGDLAARVEALASEGTAPGPRWNELKASIAEAARDEGTIVSIRNACGEFHGRKGEIESWQALDRLIDRQHWRAAKFDLDGAAINYRRFFTISDLVAVRVELPEVFDAAHRMLLGFLAEGLIDGIRIDHIDGLRDPKAYCRRLRERAARPFYLVVEKILAPDEDVPEDWDVDGTTGYEVANDLVGLLTDPGGTDALSETYSAFTGHEEPPEEIVHAAKVEVMTGPMAAELDALVARLHSIADGDPMTRDLARTGIRTALVQTVASLRVYRTYVDETGASEMDRARLAQALEKARGRASDIDPAIFDFLAAVLTLDLAATRSDAREAILDTVLRAQQFTGPVMAKGLEDTALYRYNRLIALNEVGSEPGRFGIDVDAFHAANTRRCERAPLSLIATSTHDTKRGEDARIRIAALAGRAGDWRTKVFEWRRMLNEGEASTIDPNEEYFLYQLLLGAWPFEWRRGTEIPPDALGSLRERVEAAMLKSVREAGVNTRWVFGSPDYEAAVAALVARALDPSPENGFRRSFRDFEAMIVEAATRAALVQTALRLTIPGVPDTYQGAELWEQSLVDPDNRRPVDFAQRTQMLAHLRETPAPPASRHVPSGEAKLALTETLLRLRRDTPALFAEGSYEPLQARGGSGRLCAFVRRRGEDRLVVAADLYLKGTLRGAGTDLTLDLPACEAGWLDLSSGRQFASLLPDDALKAFPVALLVPQRG